MIAEIMLFSNGFKDANILASKMVHLFELFKEQLSRQNHYDFGLRALKSVLLCSGIFKRTLDASISEREMVFQAVKDSIKPKLVSEDQKLFSDLLLDIFGQVSGMEHRLEDLIGNIRKYSEDDHLIASSDWVEKLLQLYQIMKLHHGITLVGPSGSGKSKSLQILLKAMSACDKVENTFHRFDPKSLSKEEIYGYLDSTTLEWNDGLFTQILRKIVEDLRGESKKRHFIIFDGDVDPVWIENLNSVLDDNKVLTLPTGERIIFPKNVKLVFEVENLKKVINFLP
jgi:dynein heavy chain 1